MARRHRNIISINVYPSSGRGPEGLPSAKPISENEFFVVFPTTLEEAPEGLPSAKPIWKKSSSLVDSKKMRSEQIMQNDISVPPVALMVTFFAIQIVCCDKIRS